MGVCSGWGSGFSSAGVFGGARGNCDQKERGLAAVGLGLTAEFGFGFGLGLGSRVDVGTDSCGGVRDLGWGLGREVEREARDRLGGELNGGRSVGDLDGVSGDWRGCDCADIGEWSCDPSCAGC